MNRFLFLAITILFMQPTLARDTGYAMECVADADSPKMIVSFLETGVNKRVRYVKNASGEMWDEHEWLADRFFVRSFRQSTDAPVPVLVSSLEVARTDIARTDLARTDIEKTDSGRPNTENSATAQQDAESESLRAVFVQGDATKANLLCRRWSPQMRNK